MDINIVISKETRMVDLSKSVIGNDSENLQGNLIFSFDEFVDGVGRLDYLSGGQKHWVTLTKDVENETYSIPVKNVLTKKGKIELQLCVTESETEEGIPLFKSNVFYVYCNSSINAVEEQPEGYEQWIEIANAKIAAMDEGLEALNEALEEVDNLDLEVSKVGKVATLTITKKDGTEESVQIKDGEYNFISGTNIEIEEEDNNIKINNTYDDSTILENIETLTEAIGEHDTDIQNIQNDIDSIEEDINTLDSRETASEGQISALNSSVSNIEEDIDDISGEIGNLYLQKQEKLTAGEGINIDENNVISATGSKAVIVDIGSYQYTYEGYVLPAIDVSKLNIAYANEKTGIPQVLKWTIYGNETYLRVVSSDEIAGTKTIDVLIHNKYHCAYNWTSSTTGRVNPEVQTQQEVPTFTNSSLGTIKGSTSDGNVSANSDGTGSVNGWTQLTNRVTILEGTVPSKENASNKVTSIDENSTNTEYPSAKAVYDLFNSIESADNKYY